MLHSIKSFVPFPCRPLFLAICLGAVGGCSSGALQIPEPLLDQQKQTGPDQPAQGASAIDSGMNTAAEPKGPSISATPAPLATPSGGRVDRDDRLTLDDKSADIRVNLEDVDLPAFVNEVFGNLLGLPFEIDSALKTRNERVTLRLEQPQSKQTIYDVASQVLANYGVEILRQGNVLRFQIKQIGLSPEEPPILISGDARPDVPIAYRPVFQFVPLNNVDPKDVIPWLNSAYEKSGLSATADNPRGGLMLKGMAAIVRQAAEAVRLLDQPFMRGQYSLRIDPAFISSADLAKQLKTLLAAQGYSASIGEPSGSIVMVPLESSNGLIVFTSQPELLGKVREWAGQVDRIPLAATMDQGPGAENEGLFFYEVRNTRASELAKSLRSLVSGLPSAGAYGLTPDLGNSASRRAAADSPAFTHPGQERTQNDMSNNRPGLSPLLQLAGTQALLGGGSGALESLTSGFAGSGSIVEDENRNAILFRGPARTWQQLQPLLRQMDKPARQVLIEVTVASVNRGDSKSIGLNWSFRSGKANIDKDFARAFGLGDKGFSYVINTAGGTKATLSALANDQRVRILATPRVLVKSGEQANINVGSDIPVVTGQQTDGSSTGGTSNLLQSISYRSTGIILNVSPVVYSNNRVDLTVSQEVSNAGGGSDSSSGTDSSGGSGGASSPIISRTSLETALTLQSGGSIFMGGLIRETTTDANSGIPWLKDIPGLGYLFGSRSLEKSQDEVVMLIQPYVIESGEYAKEITEKLRQMIEPSLACAKAPGACS
ncbi:Type II secretion system protein D [compost metagenome]|uniref:General secretion pathway protein D n=1 Tax=Pseudomonas jinjuensis TaxID=198616 RepID=A0A1G9YGJ4_9PSED|nr:general secretion pathway protein D [Pseudomonas jinjuensis]